MHNLQRHNVNWSFFCFEKILTKSSKFINSQVLAFNCKEPLHHMCYVYVYDKVKAYHLFVPKYNFTRLVLTIYIICIHDKDLSSFIIHPILILHKLIKIKWCTTNYFKLIGLTKPNIRLLFCPFLCLFNTYRSQ